MSVDGDPSGMDEGIGLDVDLGWPPERPPRFNPRVLPPIFGAYHAARHRLDGAAREHGLDATECMVLAAIWTEPLGSGWSIRRKLGFPRSTMTSILDRLERGGLIERRAPEFTHQRFELELTPAGRTAADLARYVITALEVEIAGYTSPQQRRGAVDVFEACMALDRPYRPHP
jgi:DNA-binding MarR family transcriptional regulator